MCKLNYLCNLASIFYFKTNSSSVILIEESDGDENEVMGVGVLESIGSYEDLHECDRYIHVEHGIFFENIIIPA